MASRKSLKRPAPENEYDRLRQRRRRTAFTDEQLDRLEESFDKERFPGIQIREDLARELNIGEDRIHVWFQNRRARWRKREIKNKPALHLPTSEKHLVKSDITIGPTMFQPSHAIFSPVHSAPFRPWEPFYPPLSASPLFPPRSAVGLEYLHRETNIPTAVSQVSQTVSVMVKPRVSASASPPFSSRTSPYCSLATPYQASCAYDLDNGNNGGHGVSRHSADDYLAAVTLACGFQREN